MVCAIFSLHACCFAGLAASPACVLHVYFSECASRYTHGYFTCATGALQRPIGQPSHCSDRRKKFKNHPTVIFILSGHVRAVHKSPYPSHIHGGYVGISGYAQARCYVGFGEPRTSFSLSLLFLSLHCLPLHQSYARDRTI